MDWEEYAGRQARYERNFKREMRIINLTIEGLNEEGIETSSLDAWRLRIYKMAVRDNYMRNQPKIESNKEGETGFSSTAIDLFLRDNFHMTNRDNFKFARDNHWNVKPEFKQYCERNSPSWREERELI